MTKPAVQWSYSSWKCFKNCPKQYYHYFVVKDAKTFGDAKSSSYGTDFHEAVETSLKESTPLPAAFQQFQPHVEAIRKWPGKPLIEYKMALGPDLKPCFFFDKNYFVRGVVDVAKVDGQKARVLDWKTGKSAKYADPKQLELMSLMVFSHFPEVEKVQAGLMFIVPDKLVPEKYDRKEVPERWQGWLYDIHRMEVAFKTGVFNPSPNGLCRAHCNVMDCPHNGKNR